MSNPTTTTTTPPMHELAPSLAAAIEAGRLQSQLHTVADHLPVVAIPSGYQLAPVPRDDKRKLDRPRFLTAQPQFFDVAGFIAYVNAYKDPDTRIWYDQDGEFLAVFDYHQSGRRLPDPRVASADVILAEDGAKTQARHGDHQAAMQVQRSPEWQIWAGMSGKSMPQQQFAEFLEENVADVLEEDRANILAAAAGLTATVQGSFKSAINQSNGSVAFGFDQTIAGQVQGGQAEVPTSFRIGLRPFMGCSRYPVECRFRFRHQDGGLKLFYKALRLEPITELALTAMMERVRDQTGIAPALGTLPLQSLAAGV